MEGAATAPALPAVSLKLLGNIEEAAAPSTTLRVVPLPRLRRGRMALAFLALLVLAAPAQAAPVDPSIGKVEVTLDLPKDKPFVGEMIILRVRSFIRAYIVLDQLRQPPMVDFDVQQLGRDKPIEAMVDGFQVQGIERDLAIFPQQSGRLIIPPFVRHVTVANDDGSRSEGDFTSKPVYVDIQNYQAINPAGAWWLPVKSLTLTDSWSPEADEIPAGTLSRRTLKVEAVGMTADRLPPPPEMRAPGIIVFRGPTTRETQITEDGPIARATYQWDLRPATGAPAKMPEISIPWFDTGERRMRQAAIPERWVAYLGTFVHTRLEKLPSLSERVLRPAPLAAGLAGFAWTAALVGFLVTRPTRDPGARRIRKALVRLRRRARLHDEPGFRAAAAELARLAPDRWRRVAALPEVGQSLAALDGARFGRGDAQAPALAPLAKTIVRAWHAAEARAEARDRESLPPLDGDLVAPATWHTRLRSLVPGRHR